MEYLHRKCVELNFTLREQVLHLLDISHFLTLQKKRRKMWIDMGQQVSSLMSQSSGCFWLFDPKLLEVSETYEWRLIDGDTPTLPAVIEFIWTVLQSEVVATLKHLTHTSSYPTRANLWTFHYPIYFALFQEFCRHSVLPGWTFTEQRDHLSLRILTMSWMKE